MRWFRKKPVPPAPELKVIGYEMTASSKYETAHMTFSDVSRRVVDILIATALRDEGWLIEIRTKYEETQR